MEANQSPKNNNKKPTVEVTTVETMNDILDPRFLTRDELYQYALNHGGVIQRANFKPYDFKQSWKLEGWEIRWLIDHDSTNGYSLTMFGTESGAKAVAKRGKKKIFLQMGFSEEEFEMYFRNRGIPEMFSQTMIKAVAAIIYHPEKNKLIDALRQYGKYESMNHVGWKKVYMKKFDGIKVPDRMIKSIAKVIQGMYPEPESSEYSDERTGNLFSGKGLKVTKQKPGTGKKKTPMSENVYCIRPADSLSSEDTQATDQPIDVVNSAAEFVVENIGQQLSVGEM